MQAALATSPTAIAPIVRIHVKELRSMTTASTTQPATPTPTDPTPTYPTPTDPTSTDPAPAPRRYPEPRLEIRPADDPVLASLGHDPRSDYVETFWLPILGPSATLLVRRIALGLERCPDGFDIDTHHWAEELGLGSRGGKHSPLWRSIDRLCRFGLARRNGPRLVVHRQVPPLTLRQVERLPAHLRRRHDGRGSGSSPMPRAA